MQVTFIIDLMCLINICKGERQAKEWSHNEKLIM